MPAVKPEVYYHVWTSKDKFGACGIDDADRFSGLAEAREEVAYLKSHPSYKGRRIRIYRRTITSKLKEVK